MPDRTVCEGVKRLSDTDALDTFSERNLDFVDCVLCAYHKVKGVTIATFDRKLSKLIG